MRSFQWARMVLLAMVLLTSVRVSAADLPPATATPPEAVTVQEYSEKNFARRLRADLAEILRHPAHMSSDDWHHLGLGLTAVGGTALLDTEIRSRIQERRSSGSDDFANAIRPLGEWGALAGLGVTWIVGHSRHNSRVQRIAEDGFEASILAAGLITPALKVVVGRARPLEDLGPAYLKPFSGHQSFPSGEATEAFAVASVISAHTKNPWLKGSMWGLAGLVAWERVNLDAHWSSDVVAGALIGAGIGKWVVKRGTREHRRRVDVVLLPVVAPGVYAVSGAISW